VEANDSAMNHERLPPPVSSEVPDRGNEPKNCQASNLQPVTSQQHPPVPRVITIH